MKKWRQLTHEDRIAIEALLRCHTPKKEIAEILGFHVSTIYREVKRGLCVQYDTELREYLVYSHYVADDRHDLKFANKGAPLKLFKNPMYVKILEELIVDNKYSPGAASAVLRNTGDFYLSENTIYRYINHRLFPRLRRHHLPEKGIRKHPINQPKTKKEPRYGTSIEMRPAVVAERLNVGHWEFDSIIGKSEGRGESALVFTERKSHAELIFKVSNKTSACTIGVLDYLDDITDFPRLFQSITMDNGSEFASAERIEFKDGKRRTFAYYCHPYTSCERGSNENANRLIRRFLPKHKSIKHITQADCIKIARWMNNYPRQSLGWKTPAQVFLEDCEKQGIKISPEFLQYLS